MAKITVDQALANLEKSSVQDPTQTMNPDQVIPALLRVQDSASISHILIESIIDILRAFNVVDREVLQIAIDNTKEFDMLRGEPNEIIEQRYKTLVKKLSVYAKTKKTEPPKKGGHRK